MMTLQSSQKFKCPQCGWNKEGKGRSNQQNKSYWLLIIQPLSEHLALNRMDVHDLCKHKFLKEVHYANKRDGTIEELIITKSTTSLTTIEFEEYCSQLRIWASQLGCYCKEPNEVISDNP